MKRKIIFIICAVLVPIIIYLYLNLFSTLNIGVDGLYFENISVSEKTITINGGTLGSAGAYKGFEYVIEDKNLYIKVNYIFFTGIYKSGNFKINIKHDFSKINKIYITDGKKYKIIWSK